jgi:hypothetical protein
MELAEGCHAPYTVLPDDQAEVVTQPRVNDARGRINLFVIRCQSVPPFVAYPSSHVNGESRHLSAPHPRGRLRTRRLDSRKGSPTASAGISATPALPTIIASVRDIEHLVAIGQRRSVAGVLTEILRPGDERQTCDLGVALKRLPRAGRQKSLLMQAWNRLPFAESSTDPAA